MGYEVWDFLFVFSVLIYVLANSMNQISLFRNGVLFGKKIYEKGTLKYCAKLERGKSYQVLDLERKECLERKRLCAKSLCFGKL